MPSSFSLPNGNGMVFYTLTTINAGRQHKHKMSSTNWKHNDIRFTFRVNFNWKASEFKWIKLFCSHVYAHLLVAKVDLGYPVMSTVNVPSAIFQHYRICFTCSIRPTNTHTHLSRFTGFNAFIIISFEFAFRAIVLSTMQIKFTQFVCFFTQFAL